MTKRGAPENLIPLSERSKEEQREIQAMGGLASGEARRKRKALKEYAEMALNLPLDNKKYLAQLQKMGIDPDDRVHAMMAVVALIKKAESGDVGAFKELRNLVGESLAAGPGSTEDDGMMEAIERAVKAEQKKAKNDAEV